MRVRVAQRGVARAVAKADTGGWEAMSGGYKAVGAPLWVDTGDRQLLTPSPHVSAGGHRPNAGAKLPPVGSCQINFVGPPPNVVDELPTAVSLCVVFVLFLFCFVLFCFVLFFCPSSASPGSAHAQVSVGREDLERSERTVAARHVDITKLLHAAQDRADKYTVLHEAYERRFTQHTEQWAVQVTTLTEKSKAHDHQLKGQAATMQQLEDRLTAEVCPPLLRAAFRNEIFVFLFH